MQELSDIYDIPLKDIRVSALNVRKHDRGAEIEFLAKSIKKHGLLQPVVLRGVKGKPPFDLVSFP
jgi:ParB-like chromosome segregation protein Spo0J